MARKWYEIRAQAGERSAELWIYDVIGVDFWGDGVSAAEFAKDVSALDVDEINVHINSPGGSFFDGVAIHAALVRHPAKVTAYVDGYAASAAWLVALAGDRVVMAENAFMMFHKAYTITMGNDAELAQTSVLLTKIDDQQIATGMGRSTKPEATMREAMAAGETWLNADEAVEWGFADEVAEQVRAAAQTHFDFRTLGIKGAPVLGFAGEVRSEGRVLSAKNLEKLNDAHAAIGDVIDDATKDTDTRDEGGAPAVASDEAGGAPAARSEAFVPGLGFARF